MKKACFAVFIFIISAFLLYPEESRYIIGVCDIDYNKADIKKADADIINAYIVKYLAAKKEISAVSQEQFSKSLAELNIEDYYTIDNELIGKIKSISNMDFIVIPVIVTTNNNLFLEMRMIDIKNSEIEDLKSFALGNTGNDPDSLKRVIHDYVEYLLSDIMAAATLEKFKSTKNPVPGNPGITIPFEYEYTYLALNISYMQPVLFFDLNVMPAVYFSANGEFCLLKTGDFALPLTAKVFYVYHNAVNSADMAILGAGGGLQANYTLPVLPLSFFLNGELGVAVLFTMEDSYAGSASGANTAAPTLFLSCDLGTRYILFNKWGLEIKAALLDLIFKDQNTGSINPVFEWQAGLAVGYKLE